MAERRTRGTPNRYAQIIERLFFRHYREGDQDVSFVRSEINDVAVELGVEQVLNLGDLMYSFRYRASLPEAVRATAPEGMSWIIRSTGRSRYSFVLVREHMIQPNPMLAETKVPDATPGVVAMYSGQDEQALLAKVRYNRLIDVFTGVTAYSLQNHLRTTVPGVGQVETDEIYVGVDARGAHYVFPVQAKGGTDHLSVVQIEQDFAVCASKFPGLIDRPIGAPVHGARLDRLVQLRDG